MTLLETIASGEHCKTVTSRWPTIKHSLTMTAEALLKDILASSDLGIHVLTWPMKTVPSLKGFTLRIGLDNLQQCHLSQWAAPLLHLQWLVSATQTANVGNPMTFIFSLLPCYFFQPDQLPGSVHYAVSQTPAQGWGRQELWMGTARCQWKRLMWNSLGWTAFSARRGCSGLIGKTFYGLYFQMHLRHLEIQDWLFLNSRVHSTIE